jgi:PAS domain S-box-containing protein
LVDLGSRQENDKHQNGSITSHFAQTTRTLEQSKETEVSDDQYRKILDSSLDGVIVLRGTKIIYSNHSEAKLLGYDKASDLIGRDISENLPLEEKERVRQRTLSRQRGESVPDRYELKLVRKDGKIIEIETATTSIIYDGERAVLAQSRDVTASKRFERQVMALYTHATYLSHASDYEQICEATLDAIESVIGFHLASYLKVEVDTLQVIESRGASILGIQIPISGKGITAKAAREKNSVLVNDLTNDPNFLRGSTDSLSELAVPVLLDGETVAVLNLEDLKKDAFDVVDQKLLETLAIHVGSAIYRIRELDRIRDQEERKAKEMMAGAHKVVSMVRHDLRGPLQTIQNAAYLMSKKHIGAEEFTKKINDSVAYAVKILNDLNVMMGPEKLKRERVDLNELMKGCLQDAVISKGVTVDSRYGAPVFAEVDQYKVRRVMDNLVKKGVEAMTEGGMLSIMVEASNGDAIITVGDTGGGIPADVALRIFTPFYTTKKAGTGLGLAICKQVVEAHGGKIKLESVVGSGTIFTIYLPLSSGLSVEKEDQISKIPAL